MSKRIEELDKNFQDTQPKIEDGVSWTSARDTRFTVSGLPWFEENGREFLRFPKRAKGVVRDPVWELSTMPSGGRVRFKTDSTCLKLRIQHGTGELAMNHMCAVGMSGIDVYEGPPERLVFWVSNRPTTAKEPYISEYLQKLPKKLREFTLYLLTYNKLALLEIGLDAPLLLMTSIRWAGENFAPNPRADETNAIVFETFQRFRSRGDRHVHYLDCREIIGLVPDHPSVDGCHLTDLGYKILADGLAPVLKGILKL
jgi:hypothetical protein